MKRRLLDAKEELLEEFERALRVSEYLLGVLPSRLWRAGCFGLGSRTFHGSRGPAGVPTVPGHTDGAVPRITGS